MGRDTNAIRLLKWLGFEIFGVVTVWDLQAQWLSAVINLINTVLCLRILDRGIINKI